MGLALKIILGTASRGALIALIVTFLFALFRASARQRMIAMVIAIAMVVSIPIFMRGNALERLATLAGGENADAVNSDVNEEAKESRESRSYLLRQSIVYTFQHPIFGVGMGQFSTFEGFSAKAEGRIGNWHETHNAFTEVSSECGIPALIFFALGIGSAFGSVSKVYRQARREKYTEIANTSFCFLLSLTGFVVSIIFLANAYRFYLPMMIGLAIALSAAAKREMSAGRIQEPVRPNNRTIPVPVRSRMARL